MEAEAYDGPSIIIAYSHCIAHGSYRVLRKINPEGAARLMEKANAWTAGRFEYYQKLAALRYEK
jgi:pyruvate/2-oxoacid:ferredoxin oxidoreductase beta subunit